MLFRYGPAKMSFRIHQAVGVTFCRNMGDGLFDVVHGNTVFFRIGGRQKCKAPGRSGIGADFRGKYGISDQATVIVSIARLAELKGHEYIIESARRLSPKHDNCVWLFVGDGRLTKQLKEKISLYNLSHRFKFTGLLSPDKIPLAIHASDILVHCSLREGLARVLPQAMLCAKPVVSFDIDGAKEVVNENTGILLEPKNIDQLTEACEKLITDPDLRTTLGQAGRQQVTEQFAPNTMVDTIENLYNELLA